MEVGQAADPDVAMTEAAATMAETVEEIREAKRLRLHGNLRLIASLPTMHSNDDMLGAMAGQACGGPRLPEDNGKKYLCGAHAGGIFRGATDGLRQGLLRHEERTGLGQGQGA